MSEHEAPDEDAVPADAQSPSSGGTGSGGGAGEAPGRSPRSVGDARWWRLGLGTAVLVALVWGVGALDGTVRLEGGTSDGAAGSDDRSSDDRSSDPSGAVDEASFVGSAALGCPGPELLGVEGQETTQSVDVSAGWATGAVLERMAEDGVVVPSAVGGPGDDDDAQAADAELALTETGPAGRAVGLPEEGAARLVLDGPAGALVLAAGPGAPGVVGGQLGLGTDPGTRGLSLTACTTATESQWLVGGGEGPGRSEQLVLTNPGDDAVTVEVALWGADGPVPTTGAAGIVVPGRGRAVQLLDALAPSVSSPVVRVHATGGPVVAHLGEHFRDGTTDRGAEVVLTAAEPTTDLVVPALPRAEEGREHDIVLRLLAPGADEAVVDLTALTEDGARRLAGAVTRVPAGHTVDVALEDLPEGTTALRLRSDQPVTAGTRLQLLPSDEKPTVEGQDEAATTTAPAGAEGARTTAGPDQDEDAPDQDEPLVRPAGDLAWVAATTVATSPVGAALPAVDAVPGVSRQLAVSAVDGTDALVVWLDEDGRASVERLELRNDTTVLVPVPAAASAVWVTSTGSAGVAASVLLQGADEGGPYVAATTLPRVPWQRQVTQVGVVLP
ncbi:DUF5719 family protein [Ornithinimicrobium sp. LYQ103]|uniref:DUF5719 family protein n=1 Tax=Ornithinimicrobium sp. LYQ103 TaxID=3378796 RepID=UPI0038535C49